ncbi:MAG: hypothetical protein WC011_01070 [Candidatus Paceibacterota bacterium]
MKTNKGFMTIIISIIVLTSIGGFLYYQNTQKINSTDETNLDSNSTILIETQNSNLAPKEIFIRRITETNNAKNFEEALEVIKKYDTKIQIVENNYENASPEKKQALYTILQGLFPSIGDLKNITEVIENDKAKVTAETKDGEITADFIKEEGNWKISDLYGF